MHRFILSVCLCLSLSASAYSETKRELKEKISELENINLSLKTQIDSLTNESDSLNINNLENQIQALLSEVPCLIFSEEVEGEYLTSYMVAISRNEQAAFSVASDKSKVELATRL